MKRQRPRLTKLDKTIRCFVEASNPPSEKTLGNLGFELTAIALDKTPERWLRLYLSWKANAESRDKWVRAGGSSWGTDPARRKGFVTITDSTEVEFSAIPLVTDDPMYKDLVATLTVGIYGTILAKGALPYRFDHLDQLKYGCLVWFAPRDWNTGTDRALRVYHPRGGAAVSFVSRP